MSDRSQSLAAWHEDIYQILMRYHKSHSDFRFPLRQVNRKNKLENGLWFLGQDNNKNPYLLIGLTKKGDGKSQVHSIGISVRFAAIPKSESLEIKSVTFQAVCRDEKNAQYQNVFIGVLNDLGVPFTGWGREYTVALNYSGSIEKTVVDFLDTHWHKISDIYKSNPSLNFSVSEDEFKDYLKIREDRKRMTLQKADNQTVDPMVRILKNKKQIILQGAPGVGKTYTTKELALRILEEKIPETRDLVNARYAELVSSGRIAFTTFHQSMDYEDFIEGYKPLKNADGAIGFELKPGVFRQICERCHSANLGEEFDKAYTDFVTRIAEGTAIKTLVTPTHKKPFDISKNSMDSIVSKPQTEIATGMVVTKEMLRTYLLEGIAKDWKPYTTAIGDYIRIEYKLGKINRNTKREPCVLIIDEINRGNVSKIFGELITVLETDKRESDPNIKNNASETISVKLTYSQTDFMVPYNLYIIGTMNTADRSLGQIDYALRRRFAFYTLKSDRNTLEKSYEKKPVPVKERALVLYDLLDSFFHTNGSICKDFNADDIMVGHSYLMADTSEDLEIKVMYELLPLLEEYRKDGLIISQEDSFNALLGGISAGNS